MLKTLKFLSTIALLYLLVSFALKTTQKKSSPIGNSNNPTKENIETTNPTQKIQLSNPNPTPTTYSIDSDAQKIIAKGNLPTEAKKDLLPFALVFGIIIAAHFTIATYNKFKKKARQAQFTRQIQRIRWLQETQQNSATENSRTRQDEVLEQLQTPLGTHSSPKPINPENPENPGAPPPRTRGLIE